MKRVRWTIHALRAMQDRHLELSEVGETLRAPEPVMSEPPVRAILLRQYVAPDRGRQMLLRVAVEETPSENVTITVYRSPQIGGYLTG